MLQGSSDHQAGRAHIVVDDSVCNRECGYPCRGPLGFAFAGQSRAVATSVVSAFGIRLSSGEMARLSSFAKDGQRRIRHIVRLAGYGLNPGGEGVPRGCVGDGYAYLLDEDEESARPDCGAMDLARGPQVVGHQNEQEDVRAQCGGDGIPVAPDWPTCDGGDHQGNGADKDQALMG